MKKPHRDLIGDGLITGPALVFRADLPQGAISAARYLALYHIARAALHEIGLTEEGFVSPDDPEGAIMYDLIHDTFADLLYVVPEAHRAAVRDTYLEQLARESARLQLLISTTGGNT